MPTQKSSIRTCWLPRRRLSWASVIPLRYSPRIHNGMKGRNANAGQGALSMLIESKGTFDHYLHLELMISENTARLVADKCIFLDF